VGRIPTHPIPKEGDTVKVWLVARFCDGGEWEFERIEAGYLSEELATAHAARKQAENPLVTPWDYRTMGVAECWEVLPVTIEDAP
jgi:hypothetical protein